MIINICKYILMLSITVLLSLIYCSVGYTQAAVENPGKEKVTFIYIHGVATPDPVEFNGDAKELHKYFAGKTLGNLVVSPEFKTIFWGGLTHQGKPGGLFKDGLIRMNTTYNRSKVKNTADIELSLLNPVYRFLAFRDSGSSNTSVCVRNLIHNYLYDIVWLISDSKNKKKVFDLMQDQINEVDGKYIIVAHSFGAAIAINFVRNKIALNSDDPDFSKTNYDNCAGLITSGDLNNTLLSTAWSEEVEPEVVNADRVNLINYFTKNDKFWISYNHRNDIIGSGLAPVITSYNDNSKGFVVFRVKKSNYMHNFVKGFKFWDRRDGLYLAHEWIFENPKSFAKSVLEAYAEAKGRK